ncbi:MAG: 5-(carboxyamino)imidazole ribonucleotide mutase [Nitrospirota bacterium]
MNRPLVAIVMGSESDLTVMNESAIILDKFNVPYEVKVASAHRSPGLVHEFSKGAEDAGFEVIIAGAGGAAHLPGVIAAETVLPVIGVPIDSSPLNGFDSLLSIVQMPAGVPVATMAVGVAGARNAALLAIQILSRKDVTLLTQLKQYKNDMADAIEKKQEARNKKQE